MRWLHRPSLETGQEAPARRGYAGFILLFALSITTRGLLLTVTPLHALATLGAEEYVNLAYAAADAWICRELYLRFESLDLLH